MLVLANAENIVGNMYMRYFYLGFFHAENCWIYCLWLISSDTQSYKITRIREKIKKFTLNRLKLLLLQTDWYLAGVGGRMSPSCKYKYKYKQDFLSVSRLRLTERASAVKTRMNGLSCGEKIMTIRSAVLIQYQRVTDRRTDGQNLDS